MRAAVIRPPGKAPALEAYPDPEAAPGHHLIEVAAGSIGPRDVMRAQGLFGPVAGPYVVGGEGVGRLADGRRVYFGHSTPPLGAWAERTLVPEDEVWPIPDDIADDQAIALAISGIGALVPLEEAKIQPGERVLILGATGPLGQIALQLARVMGAGAVVAAARNAEALAGLKSRGLADETVILGAGDDDAALKAKSEGGYNVVLDVVYGPPAEAALRATALGARMMSIGIQAGATMNVPLHELVFRSHAGVGTGQRPAAVRKAVFDRLIELGRSGKVKVDTIDFGLDDAAKAWAAQDKGPRAKVIVRP